MTGLLSRLFEGASDVASGVADAARSAYNYVTAPSAPVAEHAVDQNNNDIDSDNEDAAQRGRQNVSLPFLPKAAGPIQYPNQNVNEAAKDIEDVARKMNQDFQNNVLPKVAQVNAQADELRRLDAPQKNEVRKLRHESDDLEQQILSLRDQIESVNARAQRISNEAKAIQLQVTGDSESLNVVSQLINRLRRFGADQAGANDPQTTILLENIVRDGQNKGRPAPIEMNGNAIKTAYTPREVTALIENLVDYRREIEANKTKLTSEMQEKTKEAQKTVERYIELWKLLKDCIDKFNKIISALIQLIKNGRG